MLYPDLTNLFSAGDGAAINNFAPPQGDPYARLNDIINGINNQPIAQAKPMGTLEQILLGIAQAASVAASPDPGAALAGQLKQKAEEKQILNQQLQQRQNMVNQAKLQVGLQQATDLGKEQAEYRQEQRRQVAEVAKEKRGLNLFKQQKDIENESAKSLAQWNEQFEANNEQARLRRMHNKAVIDLLPDKFKQAAIWEADAKSLVPDADPAIIQSIIDKKSGINNEPINSKEQELIIKVNQAHFKEAKERYELGKKKTEADIKESTQRGQAALISANAAMLSAKNQSYNNTMQNWATKQKLDIMETQFYKTPSGSVVSIDEVNKLPLTEKFAAIALPAEENFKEQQRRIQQISSAVGQTQQQTQAAQQQAEQGDQLINLINAQLKTKSKEEVKNLILNSDRSKADKDKALEYLGFKVSNNSTNTAPTNRKTIGGSSVPLPSISIPHDPFGPGSSSLLDVPSNMLMLLQNMFKKNSPEENKRALEEQRQRGNFK